MKPVLIPVLGTTECSRVLFLAAALSIIVIHYLWC